MAANNELPRGWVAAGALAAGGSTPFVQVPAVAGVTHILTDVYALLYGTSVVQIFIDIVDLTTSVILLQPLIVALMVTPGMTEETWSGQLELTAGHGLQVNFHNAVPTGDDGMVVIKGYDI